jgi:hypothetical protein
VCLAFAAFLGAPVLHGLCQAPSEADISQSKGLPFGYAATLNHSDYISYNVPYADSAAPDSVIASILVHELGHYIASHTWEDLHLRDNLNRFLITTYLFGGVGVLYGVTSGASAYTSLCWTAFLPPLLGVGALVLVRAFSWWLECRLSRIHERQADFFALLLMLDAGYDPKERLRLLERELERALGMEGTYQRWWWERLYDFREHALWRMHPLVSSVGFWSNKAVNSSN